MKPFHQALAHGLIIDNFAGGGGASTGIEAAIGRSVDIAINHDPEAIAMHRANHPGTRHYCQDVWEIDPVEVVRSASIRRAGNPNLPVALATTTHLSAASGTYFSFSTFKRRYVLEAAKRSVHAEHGELGDALFALSADMVSKAE